MIYKHRYIYTGDLPTVFIHLQNPDGSTWFPSKGDTIDLNEPIYHPLLQLVSNAPDPEILDLQREEELENEPDDEPEVESPVTDDAKEN